MLKHTFSRLWPVLALVVLPCALLWPVFAGKILLPAHLLADVAPWRTGGPANLVPWNPLQFDGIAQFYPWRKFAADTLRSGFLPLWNPHEFCGAPFLANSQSAVLYPPNVLFVILPVATAFGASALLHLIATGLFLYLYLRSEMRLTESAAAFGAVAWQLSAWQVSWLALPTFLDTSAWFPCALLLAHRLSQRPNAARAGTLGLCLGMMLLAGHLQIAVYGLGLTAIYWIFLAISFRVPARRAIALPFVSFAIGLLLAAPQLAPSIELSRYSHRAAAHASLADYRSYIKLAMPADELATLYMPGFFGKPGERGAPLPRPGDPPGQPVYHGESTYFGSTNYAETACYVGVAALLLAIAGIASSWKSFRHVPFFAIVGAAALLVALGTPLAAVLYFAVPGFSQTGSPARILVVWTLCAAILAAWGCDAAMRGKARIAPAVVGYAALGVALVAYTVRALSRLGTSPGDILLGASTDIRIAVALSLAAIVVLVATGARRIAPASAGPILVALVAVDLLATGGGYNRLVSPAQVYPKTGLIAWLIAHAGQYRIMPENRGWSIAGAPNAILPPNAATAYGLSEAQGYDSLQTGQYKTFLRQLDMGADPSPGANGNMDFTWGLPGPQSRLAALRYLIFRDAAPELGAPAYSGPDGVVYVDAGAQPRVTAARGPQPALTEISPTRIQVTGYQRSDITIADQWYPGWTAANNGRETIILRQPSVFRTVRDASPGTLSLQYRPAAFRAGLYACCVALAALIALAARAATTSVRPHSVPPSPSRSPALPS